jgi:hypothetical protein
VPAGVDICQTAVGPAHHEDRAGELPKNPVKHGGGPRIEVGVNFINDKESGIAEDGPGHGQTVALSQGEILSGLLQSIALTAGKRFKEFIKPAELSDPGDLFFRSLGLAIKKI